MAIPADATNLDMKKIIMELTGTPYGSAVPSNLEEWDWNQTVNNWSANTNSTAQPTNKYSMTDWTSYNHYAQPAAYDTKSFDLDGANDYLTGPGALSAIATLEQLGSISVWVKLDSMSANGVIWQITAEEGTANQLFILWHNQTGVIRGNVKLGNSANIVAVSYTHLTLPTIYSV